MIDYQKAELEANDDSVGYGDGSEFNLTEMTSKGLCDDVHRVGRNTAEYSRTNDAP